MGGIHTGARLAPARLGPERRHPLFWSPALWGFFVFTILPMVTLLFVSMTDWDGLSEPALFSHPVGFMRDFFCRSRQLQGYLFSLPSFTRSWGTP